MKTTRPTNRRKFLLAAGVGSAGAVAAVVAGSQRRPEGSEAAAQTPEPTGYHVSEHILKYYKTAEV